MAEESDPNRYMRFEMAQAVSGSSRSSWCWNESDDGAYLVLFLICYATSLDSDCCYCLRVVNGLEVVVDEPS